MPWTHFMDMHSGGGQKLDWAHIYIEAPESEARVIFYNRFDRNPSRVTCTCCGDDYSISEAESLKQATAYERHCANLQTPRGDDGRYKTPDDPWFTEHYYLEPDEEAEAVARGYEVHENIAAKIGREYGSDFGKYHTVEQFVKRADVLVIRADEIKPAERTGDVPDEGYVWVD